MSKSDILRVLTLICVFLATSTTIGKEMKDSGLAVRNQRSSGTSPAPYVKVCPDMDIRNTVKNFYKLANCTVIEGSLRILLIEYSQHEDQYDDFSFPNLVEVTQFFLLYRVYGLKSLRTLFPNLSVIRGLSLFYDYALVVYEMIDLEDLGLIGLTSIERGAVRLEKNPNLCYINTVDWTQIARSVDMKDNFFKGNKKYKECINVCNQRCKSTMVNDHMAPRCWAKDLCQKFVGCDNRVCEDNRKMCDNGYCCHPGCTGGCRGTTAMDCVACKNVTDFSDGRPRCIDHCLEGTYRYHARCLTDEECLAIKKPYQMVLVPQRKNEEGMCALTCPAGYVKDRYRRCQKCTGRCPKTCPSIRVDTVTRAQKLKGCTIINGALEIRITTGSNMAQELEESLGLIEEVKGFIWIHESSALLSLHFFKSLRKIHGTKLYESLFALLINENVNLQKLFSEEVEKNLEILNGGIFIHTNHKLCYSYISAFVDSVKMESKDKNDISEVNNGDRMPCDYITLNLTISAVTPRLAFLRWENIKIPDQRNLLSYVIHYMEAPVKNVSMYDGRHVCSDNLWQTKDILHNRSKKTPYIMEIMVNLLPWTQYVVYVETYTTSLATKGAISKLKYFRTAPTTPTIPQNVVVKAQKPGQLHVTWDAPKNPNGNVTHYEVYWRKIEVNVERYDDRDYCNTALYPGETEQNTQEGEQEEEKEKTMNGTLLTGGCPCPKSLKEQEKENQERLMQINFQNYLQTFVYLKRNSSQGNGNNHVIKKVIGNGTRQGSRGSRRNATSLPRRPRRALPIDLEEMMNNGSLSYNTSGEYPSTTANPLNVTTKKAPPPLYYRAVVFKKEFIISNLGHFEDYNIEVIACQERDPREPKHPKKQGGEEKLCSSRALAVARTQTSITADNINQTTVKAEILKNKTNEVFVSWKSPKNPNGLIIAYEIKFKKSDISNVAHVKVCITHKMYREAGGHRLTKLDSGNYSYSIRATSLAGNGSWTEPKYFAIKVPKEDETNEVLIIVVCLVSGIVLIVISGVVIWFCARRRFPRYPDLISANPEYMSNYEKYIPDDWEVPRDKVKLIKELGKGSFGMVWEGIASNLKFLEGEVQVAVKTVNSNASYTERMSFLNEASIMKGFKTNHVVQLLGVVSDGVEQGKPAFVIMELMNNGDLKNFLRKKRPDEEDNNGEKPPTLRQILQMAGEIADGMAYLADKKFVHRDLAARNCMVAIDLTVKIGDFGMTRDIYETDYYRKGGKGLLPVRWMAPESLKDGVFTSLSDVWSYGVVIWEMATLAAQPYQGLSNEEVLKYVISAKVMDKPEGCPDKLFDLMQRCWQYKPKQRPTFKEVIELLLPDLDIGFSEKSYFFSDENKQEISDFHEEYDDLIQDDSRLPFIAVGGSSVCNDGDEGACASSDLDDDIDFDDVPSDYRSPRYSPGRTNTSEPCNCIMLQETHNNHNNQPMFGHHSNDRGLHHRNDNSNHRYSTSSNQNSAIVSNSTDGSKESSKSSSSSTYNNPINGINIHQNIANGHVPVHLRSTTC